MRGPVHHLHNVYLPNGLQLYTDETLRVTYPFTFCQPDGCFVQKFLDAKVEQNFRRGREAALRVSLLEGKNLDIRFSLFGFSDAMKLITGERPLAP